MTNHQTPRTAILEQIPAPLLRWYHSQARILPWREHPSPYRVWISEIMLQQTRVAAVIPYFERFMAALPDVRHLAEIDETALLKLWEGLGYYSRARNLQKAAQQILQQHNGIIPADFDTLLTLPGIGRYTAGAISSIAYGEKNPAVDGNVLRVVMRLLACRDDILKEKTKRQVENQLHLIMPEAPESGNFNQALMELGATLCLPGQSAHCPSCPLQKLCLAWAENCTAEYPHKAPKKPRRIENRTILILEKAGKLAIHKRPDTGLLSGLWELPGLENWPPPKDILSALKLRNEDILSMESLPPAVHVFSHLEWHMHGWRIRLRTEHDASSVAGKEVLENYFPGLLWLTPREIVTIYSIPSAFNYYISKMQQEYFIF